MLNFCVYSWINDKIKFTNFFEVEDKMCQIKNSPRIKKLKLKMQLK